MCESAACGSSIILMQCRDNRSLDSISLHSFRHSFVCCSKVSSGGVSEATIYSDVEVSCDSSAVVGERLISCCSEINVASIDDSNNIVRSSCANVSEQ